MKKTIVITGANGLLGYETIAQLTALDQYDIHALVSKLPTEHSFTQVTYHEVDLSQPTFINDLPKSVFAVLHLAQSNNFRNFPAMANDIFDINCKATQMLLDYAQKNGAKKFIFTSTGGVYTAGQGICKETASLAFNTQAGYYASSKYISEILVKNYSHLFDTMIFRPFFIYGKRQKKDMLIPRLIGNVIAGNEIQLDGEDGLRINPIHVSDAAKALIHSLEIEGSHLINLAGNEVLSLRDIAQQIGEVFQIKPKLKVNQDKQANDLIADNTILQTVLFKPTMHFKEALNEFI